MKRVWMGLGFVLLMLLSACSSGGSGGGVQQQVTVETSTGKPGTYLTDGNGMTLYMFAADQRGGKSQCSGACAQFWPPVISKEPPQASGEAQAGLLGTVTRSDGSTQVTYNGWPLYYYKQDSGAGDLRGQGIDDHGGLWWVLDPSGHPVKGATSSGY